MQEHPLKVRYVNFFTALGLKIQQSLDFNIKNTRKY